MLSTQVFTHRLKVKDGSDIASYDVTEQQFNAINWKNFSEILSFKQYPGIGIRCSSILSYGPINLQKEMDIKTIDLKSQRVNDNDWGMDIEMIRSLEKIEQHGAGQVKSLCKCGYCASYIQATDLTANTDGKVMRCNCGYRFPMIFRVIDSDRKLVSSCPFC